MKPIFWDSEEVDPWTNQPYAMWDSKNPNVTWDGVREPGDEGYQEPPPPQISAHSNPKPTKKVKHNAFYPTNVPEQIIWLANFFNKLLGHATTLGLTGAQCAALVADARWLIYILGSWLPAQRAWAKACTDAAREAQLSDTGALMVLPVFVPPALPAAVGGLPAVVPVNAGALLRIFAAVQVLKEATGYTDAIGTDLGATGSETQIPDLSQAQPVLTLSRSGPHNLVGWGWGGIGAFLDLLRLQVDRADGQGFVDLAHDTTPDYLDTTPHPAALTKWKYRGIFYAGDTQVGLWSNVVEIIVGG